MIELYKDEKVVAEMRRHWFVIASEGILLGAAAIAPLFAFFILREFVPIQLPSSALFFFYSVFLFLLWILFFVAWTNYYLDVLVITNQRIIDVEQVSLFSRDNVSVPLENIQDVKVEVFGILPSLLDYGNLSVQTAGESREVVISRIAHPHKARERIMGQNHTVPPKRDGNPKS
ncbi:MAG: PH domain-containing protein [bacterium]|nr:PH domain-containing protein [bacterium]